MRSSAPSELLAAIALRHGDEFVGRSRRLILANLPMLEAFVARRADLLEWVPPVAAPIGFARVHGVHDVTRWCEKIAWDCGVLLLPGAVYGEPRHLRLGFGRANLGEAVERLDEYLQ